MKAFVLMPFQPEFDAVFQHLVKPALTEAGYEVARADELLGQRNVIRDIVEAISTADLVVAELTGLNANVFYELGLAHGLGVPTVLIAQRAEDIPFDLRNYRVQIYSTRFDEIEQLKTALTEIGQAHAHGTLTFGSPVSDFAPPHYMEMPGSVARSARSGSEGEAPPGFLDRMIEIDQANAKLEEVMGRITRATEDVGEDIRRTSERIDELDLKLPGVAVQAQRLASIAASDLTRYAERVDDDVPELEAAVDLLVDSGLGQLNWLVAQQGEEGLEDQRLDTQESLAALSEATSGALPSTVEFRDTILGLKDTTRELDRAVSRVSSALGKVIALLERTKSFADEGLAILDGSSA